MAQVNLVPNGSFEELDTCPPIFNCGGGNIFYATGWFNPTSCTPDLRHTCGYPGGCFIEPGFPYDGEGVAAMGVFSVDGDYREYVSIGLLEPLTADSAYQFSIQIRLAYPELLSHVGSYGAYFSTDTVSDYIGNCPFLDIEPQLQRNPDSLIEGSDEWVLWQDTLIASGNEKILTLGNFLNDSETAHFQHGSKATSAFYIDDVVLIPITIPKPNSVSEPQPNIKLTSELVSEQLEITTAKPVQLHLMDISGRMVLFEQLHIGRSSINVSSIPNGMYVAVFTSENGQTTSRKIVKVN